MDRCKLDWRQVLDLASEFQSTIGRLAPGLLEEMQGIADGVQVVQAEFKLQKANGYDTSSGINGFSPNRQIGLLDVIALNARSEIALSKWDDGCTSIGWRLPSGIQVLAQNWDWRVSIGKNLAMMCIVQPGKPKIWMVTEVI